MKAYEDMTKVELIALLGALEAERKADGGQESVIRELQKHQVELEMQNRDMREAQSCIEESRNAYACLFDFAPVGYVTFDARGVIRAINHAGAELLGREPSLLKGTPFISHIVKNDRKKFLKHLSQCRQEEDRAVSKLSMLTERGRSLDLTLHSTPVADSFNTEALYLTAMVDMSEIAEAKSLNEHQSHVEEEARRCIATELREQLVQFNTTAQEMFVRLADSVSSSDQLAALREIRELIDVSTSKIDSLAWQISPAILHNGSLEAVLNKLVGKVQQEHGIPILFQCNKKSPLPNENTCACIFQAVRELLANAVRHAQAKKILISLSTSKGNLTVEVEDDGIGFDNSRARGHREKRGGLGLLGIQRRIELHGGSLRIDSIPGQGTRAVISAPLNPKAAAIH